MKHGILEISEIYKSFNQTDVLRGLTFAVNQSEILVLLGPSGCGKSTTLKIIAGLIQPDSGFIHWENKDITNTPPHLRNFGLMFQEYALFPHMNVFNNIAFGLKMKNISKDEIHKRVQELLALVNLAGYENRDVLTLSGGEQQRVALARALAPKPRLLMLDEPLGSLDRTMRDTLAAELRQILTKEQQTSIYVTHDQEEAFALADRIIIMKDGKIAQEGTPQEIYRQPQSVFVAKFLGFNNILDARFTHVHGNPVLITPIGEIPVKETHKMPKSETIKILLRPESFQLGNHLPYKVQAQIINSFFHGAFVHLNILVKGNKLSIIVPSNKYSHINSGSYINVSFNPEEAINFLEEQN